MRVSAKGRVTIPKEIRDLGFAPGTEVEFITNGRNVYLVKASASRGEKLVLRMRGAAPSPKTTDEIMAMTRG